MSDRTKNFTELSVGDTSPILDKAGLRQLRVALELYGAKLHANITTKDAMGNFIDAHLADRIGLPEAPPLRRCHLQAVIAYIPKDKINSLVEESYTINPAKTDDQKKMRFEIARYVFDTAPSNPHGKHQQTAINYDEFLRLRAALYVLNPPNRLTADAVTYTIWQDNTKGSRSDAKAKDVLAHTQLITKENRTTDPILRRRDLQMIEAAITDERLVDTIIHLAMNRRDTKGGGIEELSGSEKYALEYAIALLEKKQDSLVKKSEASPVETVSLASMPLSGKNAEIFPVDGYFSQTEILGRIRALFVSDEIRAIFQSNGRAVLHTAPVEDGARLTSPYDQRANGARGHKGHDFGQRIVNNSFAPTDVIASAPGAVLAYFRGHPSFGNCIILAHEDGTCSLYAHLQSIPFGAPTGHNGESLECEGNRCHFFVDLRALSYNRGGSPTFVVDRGEVLSKMGNTGTSAHGEAVPIHLHYEQLTSIDIDALLKGRIYADSRMPTYASGKNFRIAKPLKVGDVLGSEHPAASSTPPTTEAALVNIIRPTKSAVITAAPTASPAAPAPQHPPTGLQPLANLTDKELIKAAQSFLQETLHISTGGIDGIIGQRTENATLLVETALKGLGHLEYLGHAVTPDKKLDFATRYLLLDSTIQAQLKNVFETISKEEIDSQGEIDSTEILAPQKLINDVENAAQRVRAAGNNETGPHLISSFKKVIPPITR